MIEGLSLIKNSSRKKLSGGVVKDGKQDQDATTHMNINIPNSEQVIEENLPKCEIVDPLDLHFKERIVKKTLYENGLEVEHTKNSIAVTEDRQYSMQPPRSMQVNIIIPNSDFKSPRCEVVKGRDLIFTEECSAKESGEESPYQAASERKYVCVIVNISCICVAYLECCDYCLSSLDA